MGQQGAAKFKSLDRALNYIQSKISTGAVKIVSFDIFDTAIIRRSPPDEALTAVSAWLDEEIVRRGIRARHSSARVTYHEAYRILAERNVAAGLDFEVFAEDLYETWADLHADGTDAAELKGLLEQRMKKYEGMTCIPNEKIKLFLKEIQQKDIRKSIRIIYISDMYVGKSLIQDILESNDLSQFFDNGYVSGDYGLLKGTGNLFAKVCELEGIEPAEMMHIGDNEYSDGIMAAGRGVQAVIVHDKTLMDRSWRIGRAYQKFQERPWSCSGQFAATFAQAPPATSLTFPEAYGQRILGPIFVPFIHAVLDRCLADGVERVYFLAREGFLLKRIYDELVGSYQSRPSMQRSDFPRGDYIGVSRLSTLFLSTRQYGLREISLALLNGRATVANLLSPIQLNRNSLQRIAKRYGLPDLDSPLPPYFLTWPPFISMVNDPEIAEAVEAIKREQNPLLLSYLEQQGLFEASRVAFVDVGWGAQIQESINQGILHHRQSSPQIFGYYLGTNPLAHQRKSSSNWVDWILADSGHLDWSSSAAFNFPQFFEAVLRAPHGSVIGYLRDGEAIRPQLKSESDSGRRREMAHDGLIALLQRGISQYCRHYCSAVSMFHLQSKDMLPYAGAMIGRAIRFPTREEASMFLQFYNVSDLGSSELLRIENRGKLSFRHPRRLLRQVQDSTWAEGALSTLSPGDRLLQKLGLRRPSGNGRRSSLSPGLRLLQKLGLRRPSGNGRRSSLSPGLRLLQILWGVWQAKQIAKRQESISSYGAFERPKPVINGNSNSSAFSGSNSRDRLPASNADHLCRGLGEKGEALARDESGRQRELSAYLATGPISRTEMILIYLQYYLVVAVTWLLDRHRPHLAAGKPAAGRAAGRASLPVRKSDIVLRRALLLIRKSAIASRLLLLAKRSSFANRLLLAIRRRIL